MIRTSLLYIFGLTLAGVLFSSCDKNLDIDPPTSIDAAQGFATRQDVEAALIGCYSNVQNGSYMGLRAWMFADLYTDNISHVGTFPSFAQIANKSILPDNVEGTNLWNTIYAGINRCNNVIASAEKISDAAFKKEAAIGEARFIRAYHYFNLLNYFGGSATGFNKQDGLGVPVFTAPTLTPSDAEPKRRSGEQDVWKQIIEDLDFAIANLPNNTGTGRANKRVATALKARAHLYRGEWADAERLADDVIKNGGYTLASTASYADMFLKKNGSESIWELQFDANNTNSIAFFYYPTSAGGRNEISASANLKAAHNAADVRLPVNVIPSGALANKTVKFNRIAGDDNVILIRLAEMILIRAEARLWQDKIADAVADLNLIVKRAGLADYAETNKDAVLDRILLERRLEFAHEGHRFFDLKRLNKLASVGISQDFRALWPIPQREVDTSVGTIQQNPGY